MWTTLSMRKSIPNIITGMRLLGIPVLWLFAIAGEAVVVGVGFFLAWLSEALDGFLARRLDAVSAWGSRFDSISDGLMFASGLAWIVMLRPDFAREQTVPLAIWVGIGAAAYLVGWIRFRRLADVHLWSAKAANFLGFLFVAWLLVFGTYAPAFFYFVIGVCILAATETLLALATRERIDEPVATIFPWGHSTPERERDPEGAQKMTPHDSETGR